MSESEDAGGVQAGGTARERIIVALDLEPDRVFAMAEQLRGVARWLKVGMTTFYSEGPRAVEQLRDWGFDVFVDLKLHDIPHQVRGAAEALGTLGAGILTVHASGGLPMMEAALEGAARGAQRAGLEPPAVIGVTVLTSVDDAVLASVGVPGTAADQVERLTRLVGESGLAGVVCSPREASSARAILGSRAFVVTPGVRLASSAADDQARIATPRDAMAAGASHLVIGRPITAAADPIEAFERIAAEAQTGLGESSDQ